MTAHILTTAVWCFFIYQIFRLEETSDGYSSEFGNKLSQGFAYIASIGPLLRDWVFL